MKALLLVLIGLAVMMAIALAQDYRRPDRYEIVPVQPDNNVLAPSTKRAAMKAAKFVNGHDARDGKLDGTGRNHARAYLKTKIDNGRGNGKAKAHWKD